MAVTFTYASHAACSNGRCAESVVTTKTATLDCDDRGLQYEICNLEILNVLGWYCVEQFSGFRGGAMIFCDSDSMDAEGEGKQDVE